MKITQALPLTSQQRATLKKARQAKGLTAVELAASVGVTSPMVYAIENGTRPAPVELMAKIANRLELQFTAKLLVELRPKKS